MRSDLDAMFQSPTLEDGNMLEQRGTTFAGVLSQGFNLEGTRFERKGSPIANRVFSPSQLEQLYWYPDAYRSSQTAQSAYVGWGSRRASIRGACVNERRDHSLRNPNSSP